MHTDRLSAVMCVGRQSHVPCPHPHTNPGPCECVSLHGRCDSPELGRLPELSSGPNIKIKKCFLPEGRKEEENRV